jgi:starvation-inducible DNA-binding protein
MSRSYFGAPPSSEAVALQDTYLDLLYLAVETEHLRWVLRPRESSLASVVLEGLAADWRRWSDVIAQQLIALDVAPDGRVDTISRSRYHNPVPPGWREPQTVLTGLRQELLMRADWCRSRADRCRSRTPATESCRLLERIADSLTTQTTVLSNANTHQPERDFRGSTGVRQQLAVAHAIPRDIDQALSAPQQKEARR